MLSDIDFALMLTILVLISATFCYIWPKICQKPHAKTPQKSSKNSQKTHKNLL
jgi:hypothetical protein